MGTTTSITKKHYLVNSVRFPFTFTLDEVPKSKRWYVQWMRYYNSSEYSITKDEYENTTDSLILRSPRYKLSNTQYIRNYSRPTYIQNISSTSLRLNEVYGLLHSMRII